MASLLASSGVVSSSSFDLSNPALQNAWTPRTAPLAGNVVLTSAAIRNTSGIVLPGQYNVVVWIASTQWLFMTIVPSKDGSPCYCSTNAIVSCPTLPLVANPTVMAEIQGNAASAACLVTIDLLGYIV